MVIVNLDRGLGNQMFQYAFYAKLRSMGKEVALEKAYTNEELRKNGSNEITDVYHVNCRFVTEEEAERLHRKSKLLSWRIKHVFGLEDDIYVEEKPFFSEYNEKFLKYEDAFLCGYWQTEKYFIDVKDEIIESFTPKKKCNQRCEHMINRIMCDDSSISIHVRLGDYLELKNQVIYGNICTKEYYDSAIAYIKSKISAPRFYVFSNDLNHAKEMFSNEEVVLVDCNEPEDAWADLYLMSLCKHHIVANSSFSWWGAYLNVNERKMVVAPKKWVNTYPMPNICPEDWIRI